MIEQKNELENQKRGKKGLEEQMPETKNKQKDWALTVPAKIPILFMLACRNSV